ncbi:hypothetical protein [Aquimarina sp. SS2-1]|uniref:hypothetical protein n=1 Tax=Aquimarina besae TaxID=3342247 RepID=UPI00366C27A9
MKKYNLTIIAFLFSMLFFTACKEIKKEESQEAETEEVTTPAEDVNTDESTDESEEDYKEEEDEIKESEEEIDTLTSNAE